MRRDNALEFVRRVRALLGRQQVAKLVPALGKLLGHLAIRRYFIERSAGVGIACAPGPGLLTAGEPGVRAAVRTRAAAPASERRGIGARQRV
jgi:hypothetical protein